MRVGLFAAFAFRPHTEHLAWLGSLAESEGHETVALSCDGAVEACYSRALLARGRSHCVACTLGGMRSFPAGRTRSCRGSFPAVDGARSFDDEVITSVRSILRIEDPAELDAERPRAMRTQLAEAAADMHRRLFARIGQERLEALLVFNGRMDLTRAAIRAAEDRGIPYVSVERGSFDTGLRLFPSADCQALRHEHALQREYADRPLRRDQALFAAALVAKRLLNMPISEWRTYNADRRRAAWPGEGGGPRILVGPSSRYEMAGEPERELEDDSRTLVDRVVEIVGATPSNVVVRGHPVWAERIGGHPGTSSTRYYATWCERRGYRFVAPDDRIDSFGLMIDADVVVATGGTIGFEAAALGKPTVSLAPCFYGESGCAVSWPAPDLAAALATARDSPRRNVRQALRGLFTHIARFTQYVGHARPHAGSGGASWEYRSGADFGPVLAALRSGVVGAWDARTAEGETDEAQVVDLMLARDFATVLAEADAIESPLVPGDGAWQPLRRRSWALPIALLRGAMRKGDRLG